MKRQAFKMYLKPGYKEEYKRRHANLFPELKALLTESGVRNYSIYLDEDTNILYAYQELEGEGGSQDLGDTDICKKWWAYMADIMETNPDNSPVSIPLPEMFHMDENEKSKDSPPSPAYFIPQPPHTPPSPLLGRRR